MPSPMLEPSTPGLTHSPSSSGNSTSSRSSSIKKRFSLNKRHTSTPNNDEKSTISSNSGTDPLPPSQTTTTKPIPEISTHQQTTRTSSKAKSIDLSRLKRKQRNQHNRWWRISDDKIKESKTSDVLGMQREVYLLFYEIVVPEV
jgi:ubiquitin carboxyl-terminal hydrolase 16